MLNENERWHLAHAYAVQRVIEDAKKEDSFIDVEGLKKDLSETLIAIKKGLVELPNDKRIKTWIESKKAIEEFIR